MRLYCWLLLECVLFPLTRQSPPLSIIKYYSPFTAHFRCYLSCEFSWAFPSLGPWAEKPQCCFSLTHTELSLVMWHRSQLPSEHLRGAPLSLIPSHTPRGLAPPHSPPARAHGCGPAPHTRSNARHVQRYSWQAVCGHTQTPALTLFHLRGAARAQAKKNVPRHECSGSEEGQLLAVPQGNIKFSPKVEYIYI